MLIRNSSWLRTGLVNCCRSYDYQDHDEPEEMECGCFLPHLLLVLLIEVFCYPRCKLFPYRMQGDHLLVTVFRLGRYPVESSAFP